MPLKDEKIQDDRIRPTPEIGCRATYPAPPASMLVRRMPRSDAVPRSGNGDVTVAAATRVDCEGAEHVHLLTIHGERGAGWLGIDFCGTPLIPSDARGHATCVILPEARIPCPPRAARDDLTTPPHCASQRRAHKE
jgi:hypothetical protein